MQTLKNDVIEITVSERGAELQSIKTLADNHDYLFNGDPKYWDFRSPLLFPVEGKLRDGKYRYEGQEFELPNHGFARTSAFELSKSGKDYVSYTLSSSEETLKHYPFEFILKVGYRIDGNRVFVLWTVTNLDDREMLFSIGAHPAFLCPPSDENGKLESCSIVFRREDGSTPDALVSRTIDPDSGTVGKKLRQYALQDGRLPVTEHLFDEDALILENRQAADVALADGSGHEFVRVRFPEPLFGVWSPAGKHAPFVCIEPWYGRCDVTGYQGELTDREWEQHCRPGETFDTEYEIITD